MSHFITNWRVNQSHTSYTQHIQQIWMKSIVKHWTMTNCIWINIILFVQHHLSNFLCVCVCRLSWETTINWFSADSVKGKEEEVNETMTIYGFMDEEEWNSFFTENLMTWEIFLLDFFEVETWFVIKFGWKDVKSLKDMYASDKVI